MESPDCFEPQEYPLSVHFFVQIRWPNQINNDLYPHFLEKNKDETSQDSSKPRSNWLASSSRKPAKTYDEYTSTSILGRIYDLVKKEDLDKAVNGINLISIAWCATSWL